MIARIAAIAACCLGTAAQAADNGVYFGLGAARTDFDLESALKNTDTGYKLLAGVRLLDSFGLEVSRADHGTANLPTGIACVALVGVNCPNSVNLKASTTAAYAVGFIDFPLLDLFAKGGVALADGKLTAPGVATFRFSDNKTDFAWGAGLQAHFGSFAVRGEYEQFKLFGVQKLSMVSASFVYTLL
jgi:opacity protein-like surface antigen